MKKSILIFIISHYASFRLLNLFKKIPFDKLKDYKVEVLISDDCSKDDTQKIAEEIKGKNTSVALNFNKSSLEYYANKYLEVLRKNHNIKNLDLQSTLLNGIEFYKISYQQFDKDLNKYIQCNLYCQKGLDYYYRILTITGLDDLSYVEALESVVSSFKEVETINK